MVRRIVAGRLEVEVSPAAFATLANDFLGIQGIQIGDHFIQIKILDDRSQGNFDDDIIPGSAVHVVAFAVFAVLCADHLGETQIEQCRLVGIDLEDDRTAVAAIASRRTAKRIVFFTLKSDDTVAAVSCLQFQFYFVYKLHGFLQSLKKPIKGFAFNRLN